MMRGRFIVVILVALAVGFAVGFVLRPVLEPTSTTSVKAPAAVLAAPRGPQYFAAHLDDARTIVAGCRDGSVRGDEYAHAGEAIKAAEGRARTTKFPADRPR